jgi:tetratricopeptide (TPR) repeat protein
VTSQGLFARIIRSIMLASLLVTAVPVAAFAPQDDYVDKQVAALRNAIAAEREAAKPKPVEAVPTAAKPEVLNRELAEFEKSPGLPAQAKPAETAAGPQRVPTQLSSLAVAVEPTISGIQLVYPWDVLVAASAFKRGDAIWVVFERRVAVRHEDLLGASGERIESAMMVSAGEATVIRYAARGGVRIAMERTGTTWRLFVKDTPIVARNSLKLTSKEREGGTASPFVSVEEPGSVVQLTDPGTGERFQVVPLVQSSLGLSQQALQTAGTFLNSAQGLAVVPANPFARLDRFRDGVMLTGTASAAGADMLTARGFSSTNAGQKLIDFARWGRVKHSEYHAERGELLYRLSRAPQSQRQELRSTLARFYLGHDQAADALGVLQTMVQFDPRLNDNTDFLAARGVAHLKLKHYADARADLERGILDAEPDIYLWRAVASEGLGEPQKALAEFEKGVDVIGWYDPDDRLRFQLAGIRAALAAGNPAIAERELGMLPKTAITPARKAEVLYLQGMLALEKKDPATAAARFAAVQALPNRAAAAKAALAQIQDELARSVVKPEAAIDRLDRLRYAWRGDALEQQMLRTLAVLYQRSNQWREGFEMLRQAVKYFPPTDETRLVTAQMENDFRRLFLDGDADKIEPITALAIYYDFRELTPLGPDGDSMIRKLADRLVSVELLDRAAGLLDHQVRYRLEGVAQANVANRLAMIHLLANDPEAAIAVLRLTRNTVLTPDVLVERSRIEARALIQLGNTEEALVLIETDSSPIAADLRAEAAWKDKDWPKVITYAQAALASVPPQGMLTADPARHAVRAAIASVMTGDSAGLQALGSQYAKRLEQAELRAAFQALTSGDEVLDDPGSMTEILSNVDKLQGGLDAYKRAFASPPPVARQTAQGAAAQPPA